MKKIRTLICIFLMVIFAFNLCGCNSDSKVDEAALEVEEKEIPKLLWWQTGDLPHDNQLVLDEMNKYSKEKIGVEADIRYIDTNNWEQKITLIIFSGDKFDIMFTDYNFYPNHARLDAFADITDMVSSETPKLKEFIPELIWNGAKVNGKLYSVPTYKDSAEVKYWGFDKNMVESLNIDYKNVSSLSDLDSVVRKLKEGYPDEYPLYLTKKGLDSILFGYDIIGGLGAMGVKYDDKTATVVNTLEQPEVLENLKIVHSWYQDGIINPGAPSTTDKPKHRAIFEAQGFEGADIIWSNRYGYDVVSSKIYGPIYSTNSIQGSLNAISSNSEYPVEALKYLELVNTDSYMRNLFAYGIENTHYKKTAEGTVEYLNDNYLPSTYSQGTFFNLMSVAPNAADQWDKVKQQNEIATASPILGFAFDPSNVGKEFMDCRMDYDLYRSDLFTGASEPETQLRLLNESLYNFGLQKLIDEAQSQIDKFLSQQ